MSRTRRWFGLGRRRATTRGPDDRLLDGVIARDDLPPELVRVAAALDALRADRPTAADREARIVAAMQQAVRRHDNPAAAPRPLRRTVVVAVLAVLVGGTSLAVAGALPGAAQDFVARIVEPIGIDLPGGPEPVGPRPDSLPSERDSVPRPPRERPADGGAHSGSSVSEPAAPPATVAPDPSPVTAPAQASPTTTVPIRSGGNGNGNAGGNGNGNAGGNGNGNRP